MRERQTLMIQQRPVAERQSDISALRPSQLVGEPFSQPDNPAPASGSPGLGTFLKHTKPDVFQCDRKVAAQDLAQFAQTANHESCKPTKKVAGQDLAQFAQTAYHESGKPTKKVAAFGRSRQPDVR